MRFHWGLSAIVAAAVENDEHSHDYRRIAELAERYIDPSLGITDAAVSAIAERLGITEVATPDRRHVTVVRPRHAKALRLLPEQLLASSD